MLFFNLKKLARKSWAKKPRVDPISSCEMPSQTQANAEAEAGEVGRVDGKPLPKDISLLRDPKAAEAVMRGLVTLRTGQF